MAPGKEGGYHLRPQRKVRDLLLPFILLISARFVVSIHRGLFDFCIRLLDREAAWCLCPRVCDVCIHMCECAPACAMCA